MHTVRICDDMIEMEPHDIAPEQPASMAHAVHVLKYF